MQGIPILGSLENTQVMWLCHLSPSGSSTLKSLSPLKGPSTLKGPSVSQLSVQDETPSTRSLIVRLSEPSLGVTVALLLA